MMKKILITIAAFAVMMANTGCEKKSNPVAAQTNDVVYTTINSVKVLPTYYSFTSEAVTDSVGAWDLKLTYIPMVVDTSIPAIKYPFIRLNKVLADSGKVVDGPDFTAVNAATVTGLSPENDTTGVIGVNCLNYDPATHLLKPFTNRTFVVRTATGARVKFKMVGYYNNAGVSGYMTIDYVKY